MPLTHGRKPDAQRRVRLARAGRSEEQGDAVTSQEGIFRERLDLRPWDAGVELPVERLERGDFGKASETDTPFQSALAASIDFTLQCRDRPRQVGGFAQVRKNLG